MHKFKHNLIIAILLLCSTTIFAAPKCTQIFYNKFTPENGQFIQGQEEAIILHNLLGHFRNIKVSMIPISQYKKGMLNRCHTNFYIGAYPYYQLSSAFINDFITTKNNVAWINNGISQLGKKQLNKIWHVRYLGKADINKKLYNKNGCPGYYQHFYYKGNNFEKECLLSKKGEFFGDAKINELLLNGKKWRKNVVSWVFYSNYKAALPYILHNKNHWYIASDPFLYTTTNGSYMIFSDVLFDILHEKPVNKGKHYAFIRLEDVTPFHTNLIQLRGLIEVLYSLKVPFALSVIPIFEDPEHYTKPSPAGPVPLNRDNALIHLLKYAQAHGGTVIMHGVTHQDSTQKSAYLDVSGIGYEFWDAKTNGPLKSDSAIFTLKRLSTGWTILKKAGFTPAAWLTPHYAASELDSYLFGQLFPWIIGNITYSTNILHHPNLKQDLSFAKLGTSQQAYRLRMKYWKKIYLQHTKGSTYFDQMFPYEIYRDIYGQRIIPVTLGHLQPFPTRMEKQIMTIPEMLKKAKRNIVLRDTWASLFFHPFLFIPTDLSSAHKNLISARQIRTLLEGIKKDGYTFIDLAKWEKLHTQAR